MDHIICDAMLFCPRGRLETQSRKRLLRSDIVVVVLIRRQTGQRIHTVVFLCRHCGLIARNCQSWRLCPAEIGTSDRQQVILCVLFKRLSCASVRQAKLASDYFRQLYSSQDRVELFRAQQDLWGKIWSWLAESAATIHIVAIDTPTQACGLVTSRPNIMFGVVAFQVSHPCIPTTF